MAEPKPKPKPNQSLTDALEHATLSSPAGSDKRVSSSKSAEGPMPPTTPKRRGRPYKSPAVVSSDDDFEPIDAETVNLSAKKRTTPAVTIKKGKIKPDDPFKSDDVLDITDTEFVVSEEEYGIATKGGTAQVMDADEVEDSVTGSVAADDDGMETAEEDSKLVGGDTMYPAPDASSLRIRLKRPAPTTPPYGTRASVTVPDTPDRSPTKKHRSGVAPVPSTPSPDKRSKRPVFPKSSVSSDVSDQPW